MPTEVLIGVSLMQRRDDPTQSSVVVPFPVTEPRSYLCRLLPVITASLMVGQTNLLPECKTPMHSCKSERLQTKTTCLAQQGRAPRHRNRHCDRRRDLAAGPDR